MSIDVSLEHITHYQYNKRIKLGTQIIRLRPAPHIRTPIHQYSLDIYPKNYFLNWQQDPFGNYLARVDFKSAVNEMKIRVGLVSEIRVFNPFDFFLDDEYALFPFDYTPELQQQLYPYLECKEAGPLLMQFIERLPKTAEKTIDYLVAVNQRVYTHLNYLIRLEPGVQTCEQTLQKNSGSCRDFTWLLCMVLRHLGLATRFVSGYIIQLKPDVKSPEGPNGPEQDFTDLHAWTEVYIPGAGWIGLDSTSGLLAGEGHIPLCCTPLATDAAPVTGTLEACEANLQHHMQVKRLHENRRITNPHTDSEWEAIVNTGVRIDQRLKAQDVRLTMGGEPTFVPFDNLQSEAWLGQSLGDEKKQQASELFSKLCQQFHSHGLAHFAQGKWYPNEALPRWAMTYYWRCDGQPLCNTNYFAPTANAEKQTIATAHDVILAIAKQLSIPAHFILPACEIKQDASQTKTSGQAIGYVLPLQFSHNQQRWISSDWRQQLSGRVDLIPGTSALGYRLPLDRIVCAEHATMETSPPRDPFAGVAALPSRQTLQQRVASRIDAKPMQQHVFVRTALSIELRAATLYVFMPPIAYLEHYLELLVAIEAIAEFYDVALAIEGYRLPSDPRISSFSVTPDPGVIEVNIFPSADWSEFIKTNQALYDIAHTCKLSTSRYLLDGRRVGTGGGNHIVLGAAKSADSPFLRRPDLLRSLLTFWQHHPSLSYLFAGEFIGPTSQAPRIDEARDDSLYELEIAFKQIPEHGDVPYWLVDRLFRNLLIDMTGNTHRAEFCIDKLYSPDSATGRLGLLELRSFEMPPHAQMAAVQALLVRAAIAKFWQQAYQQPLIRWQTRLHDEFMLPYFLWQDLQDVLDVLSDDEIKLHAAWFQSFLDFRCPVWGQTQIKDVSVELRHALEPWHVMGEELYLGNVSRAVDSSVERIQVKLSGFDERYQLLCNKHPVPLKQVAGQASYVAGIRYKAWNPPSGLHPSLPIHAPLVFDLVRKSDSYSLGGFTYHVSHPGGRSYDQVPINENEAEARCRMKFDDKGHTPGKVTPFAKIDNKEFPCTLDLRFASIPKA